MPNIGNAHSQQRLLLLLFFSACVYYIKPCALFFNFLVSLFICLSSFLVVIFIPLIRFKLEILDSRSFLIIISYSFLIFSFLSLCVIILAFNLLGYLWLSFSPRVLCILV